MQLYRLKFVLPFFFNVTFLIAEGLIIGVRRGNNAYLLDRVKFAALPILVGSQQFTVRTRRLVCTEAKSPPLQRSLGKLFLSSKLTNISTMGLFTETKVIYKIFLTKKFLI
jgi:hypothetical protein